MKKDIAYIHIIRVVACLMVVFLHSLPSGDFVTTGVDSLFRQGIVLATSPCALCFS